MSLYLERQDLDLGKVNDSKKFWDTVKPVFGKKVTTRNNITLIENEKVATSEIKLAKIFNKYFVDSVTKSGIKPVVSSRNNNLEIGNLSTIIKKIQKSFQYNLQKSPVWRKKHII